MYNLSVPKVKEKQKTKIKSKEIFLHIKCSNEISVSRTSLYSVPVCASLASSSSYYYYCCCWYYSHYLSMTRARATVFLFDRFLHNVRMRLSSLLFSDLVFAISSFYRPLLMAMAHLQIMANTSPFHISQYKMENGSSFWIVVLHINPNETQLSTTQRKEKSFVFCINLSISYIKAAIVRTHILSISWHRWELITNSHSPALSYNILTSKWILSKSNMI